MSNQGSHPTDKTDLSSNVPNSDWTMYGNVSQEWMQAKSPEELKEAAFRWSLSQDLKIRGLGLSLLGAIEAEGGEAQAQIRACLPWTVAVSHKIVPISIQEPFVVVLHAGEISVETLNLVMAYARRPVQWVQGTDAEVARELLSRYGSEIPATLLERFVNDPAVAWAGNPNPVLTVVAEPIETAVEEAQIEPEVAPAAELPDGDAEDEPNWGGTPEFPVEVLRDLRAVPMSEDESGIEFLVASPAENETLRALSELSQGAARFRIADFDEVAAAWTAKYGDELTPATPNDTRNTIIEANDWADEDDFEAESAFAEATEETTEEFVEPIAEAEIQPIAEVEASEPENLSPWQIAETRTPEDGLDSADLQALVSQYHIEEPEEQTEVEVTVSEADAEADWDSLVAAVAEEESFEVEAADGIPEVQFDPQAWAQSLQATQEEVPDAEPAAIEEEPVAEVESEAGEESIVPQPEAVQLVPASLAWFARACPMQVRGDELVCWAMEPFDESLLTAIERRADRKLVVEPRSQEEVIAALQTAYPTDFAGVNAPVAVPELAQIEEEEASAPEIAPQDIDAELTQEVETALAEPVTSSDWDEEVAEADLPSDLADEWGNEISTEPTVETTSAGIAMPPPLPLDELKAPPTLSTDFTVAEGAAETEPVAEEPVKEFNAQNTGSVALDDLLARIGIARGDNFGSAPVAEPEAFEIGGPEVQPETVEVAESNEEEPVAEIPAPVAELEPIEAELEAPAPPAFEIEAPEVHGVAEAEATPALTPAEAEVESFDAAPARPEVESTDDGFTLSATDEARAAWMEFMSGENKPTVQPRNDTTPIMIEQMLDRMNREIEVERASASAIPSADFKEEDDDGRASADAGFLTEEEAEESRIALEHASAIQRLMGQSLVPKPEILARFSRDTAIRLRTLPVTIEGGTLHVMGASALSEESVQMLSDESGLPIQLHLAPADHLQRMLDKAYPDPDRDLEQHTKVAELRRQQEMDDKGWLSKLMNRVNRGA